MTATASMRGNALGPDEPRPRARASLRTRGRLSVVLVASPSHLVSLRPNSCEAIAQRGIVRLAMGRDRFPL